MRKATAIGIERAANGIAYLLRRDEKEIVINSDDVTVTGEVPIAIDDS